MNILAIETSCDDTSAAVISDGVVKSNIISSQPIHDHWGGIVPELASREHIKAIAPIVTAALHESHLAISDINVIAVTNGPGLAGSLLVGTQFAKGLALRFNLPVIPVHHIEAHVYSGYVDDPARPFPSIALVVSGGHTSIFLVRSYTDYSVLGSTRDDAAGEAFDKISKMLGLGYPGGPHIDRLARDGNANAIDFPRGLLHDGSYNFSFSGLKTAVKYYLRDHADAMNINDVCASAQRAIVDVLVTKTMSAAKEHRVGLVTIAGGVSANSELRASMQHHCDRVGIQFVAPKSEYCVDNAAMIGFLAAQRASEATRELGFEVNPIALRSGTSRTGTT